MSGKKFKVTEKHAKIAEMVVKTSLNIKKGNCVYISGSSDNVHFMHLLAIECEKIGACPFERVNYPREIFDQIISETPIANLEYVPKHYLAILDKVDAQIIVLSLPTKKRKKYTEEDIKKSVKAFDISLVTMISEGVLKDFLVK